MSQSDRERIDNDALRMKIMALENTVTQLRRSNEALRVEVDTLLMAMGSESRYGQTKAEWLAGRNDER